MTFDVAKETMRQAMWHVYGGRHDPPCELCRMADEAALAWKPKIHFTNAFVRWVKKNRCRDKTTPRKRARLPASHQEDTP
jgi:hypothetical protein